MYNNSLTIDDTIYLIMNCDMHNNTLTVDDIICFNNVLRYV